MRKLLLFMAIVIMGMQGCKKHVPERCTQLSEICSIPVLEKESYNTCDAVYLNYAYFVRWNDIDGYLRYYPNPGEALMTDTIMMCGFIKHSNNKPFDYVGDDWWMCCMTDDSISAMDAENHSGGTIRVQCDDKSFLNEIDDLKKCHLTGIMVYDSPFAIEDSPSNPNSCYCLVPFFQIVRVDN